MAQAAWWSEVLAALHWAWTRGSAWVMDLVRQGDLERDWPLFVSSFFVLTMLAMLLTAVTTKDEDKRGFRTRFAVACKWIFPSAIICVMAIWAVLLLLPPA